MKRAIPTWREKQKGLYTRGKPIDASELKLIGDRCMEAGLIQEALEYYRGAGFAEGLGRIKDLAFNEGDAFLFLGLEKAAGANYSADDWNKLGYRAFELGKFRFAKTAFTRTENELMLAKIASTLGEETLTPPPTPHANPA